MSHQDLRKLWRGWRLTDSLCGVSPPAVLYAIQNVLVQASYEHKINSMMFNLVSGWHSRSDMMQFPHVTLLM